jgi:hypothetical protein
MEAIARRQSTAVGPPLKTLEVKIKKEIKLGDKAGYVHYRRAGEWLLEAEPRFEDYAEFIAWGESKFERSQSQLHVYMEYARLRPGRIKSTQRETMGWPKSVHAPQWVDAARPSVNRVNVRLMSQDRKTLEAETKLQRLLAHQLIDIGFKVLATKLHPDKPGGSKEAMARLNQVRQILRGAL